MLPTMPLTLSPTSLLCVTLPSERSRSYLTHSAFVSFIPTVCGGKHLTTELFQGSFPNFLLLMPWHVYTQRLLPAGAPESLLPRRFPHSSIEIPCCLLFKQESVYLCRVTVFILMFFSLVPAVSLAPPPCYGQERQEDTADQRTIAGTSSFYLLTLHSLASIPSVNPFHLLALVLSLRSSLQLPPFSRSYDGL